MMLIVPLTCFLLAMGIAAIGLKHQTGWITALCVGGSFAAFVIANAGAQAPSFEAIDDQIFAYLFFGPAFFGSLVGAAFGWWKWRRG